jgi:mannose-6-phosphate isomerase-like protein (cupin superfamily)
MNYVNILALLPLFIKIWIIFYLFHFAKEEYQIWFDILLSSRAAHHPAKLTYSNRKNRMDVLMNCNHCNSPTDFGAAPYVANVAYMAAQNPNFRTALWTGAHLQMTLMSIPPCGEIGLEIHDDTDQLIRIEQGTAVVKMGACREHPDIAQRLTAGDTVFVPAGTWHNVKNTGRFPLKVSSVYAPPHHPHGTVQKTRDDTEEY